MRFIAVLIGKALIFLVRLTGRGGSNWPGKVVRKLFPGILPYLSLKVEKNILVTGTNGKTTTNKAIYSMLTQAGFNAMYNNTGANLITGITTAYVEKYGQKNEFATLEVDEANMVMAVREIQPQVVLVTNFFRDQLDRYGELGKTVQLVKEGLSLLPEGSTIVLNADDPLTAQLGMQEIDKLRVVFYGLQSNVLRNTAFADVSDARHCLQCGESYVYEKNFYAHLGHYHCSCGFRRPEPTVFVSRLEDRGSSGFLAEITSPQGIFTVDIPLPGVYNLYNLLAAIAVALTVDVPLAGIKEAVRGTGAAFGRMERLLLGTQDGITKETLISLVKNPAGFNAVMETLLEEIVEDQLLIVVNDLDADGRDISWFWDVDFETLAQKASNEIVVSGLRAQDMAVRLKYAGIPEERLVVVPEIEKALDISLEKAKSRLYILPSYTAMLKLQDVLRKRGQVQGYWKTEKKRMRSA